MSQDRAGLGDFILVPLAGSERRRPRVPASAGPGMAESGQRVLMSGAN